MNVLNGRVAGLDLSLNGSACVVLPHDWEPGNWRDMEWGRFTIDPKIVRGMERVEIAVRGLDRMMRSVPSVFVEQYSFSFSANAITNIAELVGALKWELWRGDQILITPIVASSARKLLFGKQSKMTRKEWKAFIAIELGKMGCELPDEDSRDAFIIANAGRHALGLPCLAAG